MIRRMSEDAAWALLRAGRLARLGCIADDSPYVVPVNYAVDGASILIHTLPGRKLDAIRANPRVCLQVDDIVDQYRWRSVLAFGTCAEIKDGTERARALGRLLTQFPELTPVESLIADDAAAPAPVIFRIKIEQVTGVEES